MEQESARLARNALAADVVLLGRWSGVLSVLAIERAKEPFRGCLALPGGFVKSAEDPLAAAIRELAEETGIEISGVLLGQLGCYDTPGRDPRGRVTSLAFYACVSDSPEAVAASDAQAARWLAVSEFLRPVTRIAFDHRDIVGDALLRWFRAASCPASTWRSAGSPDAAVGRGLSGTELRGVRPGASCAPRWAPGNPRHR